MNQKKAIAATLITLFTVALFSCAKPQSEEEAAQEKKEMEQVDKTLKSDKEKMDSMKKELGIED